MDMNGHASGHWAPAVTVLAANGWLAIADCCCRLKTDQQNAVLPTEN